MKRIFMLVVILGITILSTAFITKSQLSTAVQTIQAPANIIPILDADEMYTGYGTERAAFLKSNLTKKSATKTYDATRIIVLDYADLKSYMNYIEVESRNAGVSIEDLGIYLSKYPDNGVLPSGKRDATTAGVESIFINPMTTFKGGRNSVGYAIQNNELGQAQAIPVGHIIDAKKGTTTRGAHSYTIRPTIKSLAANGYGVRPPPNSSNGF